MANAREASDADRRFQLEKACKLYHEEYGHYPNPGRLASLTLATRSECVTFLRAFLTPKADAPVIPQDEEPEQQQVMAKLQKMLASMKGITLSDNWIAGDGVQIAIKAIVAEARRINIRQPQEPDVTPQQLKNFRLETGLTMEKLGEILGVKHTTISRWLHDQVKMTEHNQRAVRQLLRLAPEQVNRIMEGEEDASES